MLSVTNYAKLTCIIYTAAKIIGLLSSNLSELNCKAITLIAITTAQDITHPLDCHSTVMPSGCRYRSLRCRRVHLGKSLVPAVIEALNRITH